MTDMPSLRKRRKLSPGKLRAARLRAGYARVAEVCRLVGIKRLGYTRWEDPRKPGLDRYDWTVFENILRLFNVAPEDITDEIPEAEQVPA